MSNKLEAFKKSRAAMVLIMALIERIGDRRATDEELAEYNRLYIESNAMSSKWIEEAATNQEIQEDFMSIGQKAMGGECGTENGIRFVAESMKKVFQALDVDLMVTESMACMDFFKKHDHMDRLTGVAIGA